MTQTVRLEESGEERPVVGACQVCKVSERDLGEHRFVLSPQGVAHHANDYGDTDCGKDATGDGWWWPL